MRIALFRRDGEFLLEELSLGYLKEKSFIGAGEEIIYILNWLPKLKPFDKMDIDAERNRVNELFTEENRQQIMHFLRSRASISMQDDNVLALDLPVRMYDKELFEQTSAMIADVTSAISFYTNISNGMQKAFEQLQTFSAHADECERLDEAHLLPLALEVFGTSTFSVDTEYVSQRKNAQSHAVVVARRLHFDSYYGFIITDFFEGLHYGHYPRKCEVCGNYFLMKSALRQRYCNGYSPYERKGKRLTCRNYAASVNRKELAEADPVVDIYNRRCAAIRTEKGRGTITDSFADAAKTLAKEHKLQAKNNPVYAKGQYVLDMQREKLYQDADQFLRRNEP